MNEQEEELRDQLTLACDNNGWYDLARRLAFVPIDVLKKLPFETKDKAEAILEQNGY